MEKKIVGVEYKKEYETRFGILHLHKITWQEDDGSNHHGFYSSKKKEQTNFVKGQVANFDVEIQKGDKGEYNKVKPVRDGVGKYTEYGKAVKREQSKYSGFAMAYAKDLVVAGKIDLEQMYAEAQCMVDWMVATDKSLES